MPASWYPYSPDYSPEALREWQARNNIYSWPDLASDIGNIGKGAVGAWDTHRQGLDTLYRGLAPQTGETGFEQTLKGLGRFGLKSIYGMESLPGQLGDAYWKYVGQPFSRFFTQPRDKTGAPLTGQEVNATTPMIAPGWDPTSVPDETTQTLNIGQVPKIPAPPRFATPEGPDFTTARSMLDQAKPTPLDQEQLKNMELTSVLGGIGTAMMQTDLRQGIGQALLRAGGGALAGLARGKENTFEAQQTKERQGQQYALARGTAESRFAGSEADYRMEAARIENQNQLNAWHYATQVAERSTPKVQILKDGQVVIQTIDPQGNVKLTMQDPEKIAAISRATPIFNSLLGGTNEPLARAMAMKMVGKNVLVNDPTSAITASIVMARDLGQLGKFFTPEELKAAQDAATKQSTEAMAQFGGASNKEAIGQIAAIRERAYLSTLLSFMLSDKSVAAGAPSAMVRGIGKLMNQGY